MLQLSQAVFDQIRQHGEATYPEECCGLLVGHIVPDGNLVTRAISVENATNGLHRNSYQIASRDLIRIHREARLAGEEILGFYHSHPDHRAEPSATDLAEAHWLGCSYLITTVNAGQATNSGSFRLAGESEENKFFNLEEIRIAI
jgi:proteasome lid subunit RPN8/RPN11